MGGLLSPEDANALFYERTQKVSANKWDAPYGGKDSITIYGGSGEFVCDANGREYLDWNNGILCTIFDYGDPETRIAVQKVLDRGALHTSSVYLNPYVVEFKEKAAASLRQYGDFVILPTSSGTVSDSMAIRIALSHINTQEKPPFNVQYIVPAYGYSGADFRANAMCGLDAWKGKSTPKIEGVRFIPPHFEDLAPFDPSLQINAQNIDNWFRTHIDDPSGKERRIPITLAEAGELGIGGFRRITSAWMRELTRTTKKRGGLFICDSVQPFPGRTAEDLWAFERWVEKPEDVPDIITTAKGLGNGLPIGIVAARRDIADSIDGKWFDTFAGNPIASAVATNVLERAQSPQIKSNIADRTEQLRAGLHDLSIRHNAAGRVRAVVGAGLMSGLAISPDKAEAVRVSAQKKGLLIALGADGTLRLAPHFDCSESNIDKGVRILDEAIHDAG